MEEWTHTMDVSNGSRETSVNWLNACGFKYKTKKKCYFYDQHETEKHKRQTTIHRDLPVSRDTVPPLGPCPRIGLSNPGRRRGRNASGLSCVNKKGCVNERIPCRYKPHPMEICKKINPWVGIYLLENKEKTYLSSSLDKTKPCFPNTNTTPKCGMTHLGPPNYSPNPKAIPKWSVHLLHDHLSSG